MPTAPAPRLHPLVPSALLLVSGCAVVASVRSTVGSVARWAESFSAGEGRSSGGKQQGEWTFTYPAGQLRARGAYKDDVQDGPWTYWFPSGDKEYEGSFVDARRSGVWRYWHANGNLRAQGAFVRGREWGEWNFWSLRGERAQRGAFANGLQVGAWTAWRDDGTRESYGLFHEGQRVGPWTFWNAEGEPERRSFEWPKELEWVNDTWPEGSVRRAGFLQSGAPVGLWTLHHRSGVARLVGSFEAGLANGHWAAFDARGERLAEGAVEAGRPRGEWIVYEPSGRRAWDASAALPSPVFRGEWSEDELARSAALDSVLATWLSEAAAPVSDEARLDVAELERAAPRAGAELAQAAAPTTVEPDVPVHAQPWTQRELTEFEDYVKAYTELASAKVSVLSSRYAPRRATTNAAPEPTGGSPERARAFLGRPLPLEIFTDATGAEVRLRELKGKRVVLVVLRGFGGGVCVYCTAQTAALWEAGALSRFESLGAELQVLFPGTRNGLEAFKRGYEALAPVERPPYGLLYQNDYLVSRLLDLEGNKVIPSTFILDEDGIVRFAYIGEHIADRPPAALLFSELEKLGPRR